MEQMNIFDLLGNEEKDKFKVFESTDWKWTFADYPKEKNGLKVFSCFACGGGSTMGYKLAGCEVLGCVEIDKRMNDVYVKNHNPKYNFLMDIRDFNALPNDQVPAELFDLDILDGSPPCTTFSMVGLREETWGKEKKFREGQAKQTLDDLSFIFIDTVKKLRPKTVIMENVEGLILGEAWSYVQRIYSGFHEAGYKVKHWLCKGERMGIPQTRHRVFFVAIRDDLGIDPSFLDMSFNYAPILYGEIMSGESSPVNPESQLGKGMAAAIHSDRDLSDVLERLGEKPRCFSSKLVWSDIVCPTVTGKAELYRVEEKGRLSIEDVIHAQTFPEDYDFVSRTLNNVTYICGMSVPPVMTKRIMTKLIEQGVYDYKTKQNKWIVNFDNGVKFGTIDLKCPKCGHCVICPKVDVPNFCGKCGLKLER